MEKIRSDLRRFSIFIFIFIFIFTSLPKDSLAERTVVSYDGTQTIGVTNEALEDKVEPNKMIFDSSGNIFIVGYFNGTDVDFDPGVGEDLKSSSLFSDSIFLTKINVDSSYGYTKVFGGPGNVFSQGKDIVLDSIGNIYITGYFGTSEGEFFDFDPGEGEDLRSMSGFVI